MCGGASTQYQWQREQPCPLVSVGPGCKLQGSELQAAVVGSQEMAFCTALQSLMLPLSFTLGLTHLPDPSSELLPDQQLLGAGSVSLACVCIELSPVVSLSGTGPLAAPTGQINHNGCFPPPLASDIYGSHHYGIWLRFPRKRHPFATGCAVHAQRLDSSFRTVAMGNTHPLAGKGLKQG